MINPQPSPALIFSSATTLARLIRSQQVSSQAVVQAHLERIAAVNSSLNAVVHDNAEQAIAAAHWADQQLQQGHLLGPLHGVPFTVKDWIDVAGMPCTGGDPAYRQRLPTADATAVQRLKAAGGICLGKTNVMIDNPVYGRTHNPYRQGYSPTGSSSGEAAIIAVGGSPLGLGSDSGGSIRQPAHACGIAGLKPTAGRVPLTGHFPVISALNDPRTVIGPMARSVADLALILPLLAGMDYRDASVVPGPLGNWRAVNLRDLRVAYYIHHPGANPTPAVEAATLAAVESLAGVVHTLTPDQPDRLEEVYTLTQAYWQRPESESADQWQPAGAFVLSSETIERHLFQWDRFRRTLIRFMANYDVVITPAAAAPALPHGEPEGSIAYTLTYSLTGYPAVVVRVGTTAEGLPIGVQVVARPWREDVALAVAHHLETRLGGWQPPEAYQDLGRKGLKL